MRADESRSACDQNSHRATVKTKRTASKGRSPSLIASMMREQINPVHQNDRDDGNADCVFLRPRPSDETQPRRTPDQNDCRIKVEQDQAAERDERERIPKPGCKKVCVQKRAQATGRAA